ncbi:hypothetical protein Goshw_007905, partial [Gossypium schwendimanii]|nr:hypothetical protein [Gossypium schwendimanii]
DNLETLLQEDIEADLIYFLQHLQAFVGKALLKVMFFSGVCGPWSIAAFVVKAPLKVMVYSGVCGKSAAKGHDL